MSQPHVSNPAGAAKPLLDVRNLVVEFRTAAGTVHAVNDVSYTLNAGETLGVVGESGSGKSVHILALLGLLDRKMARITSGEAWFAGKNLLALPESEMRRLRGARIGYVSQDPMTSLNPVLCVERQLIEPIVTHMGVSVREARKRAVELLEMVRIPDAKNRLKLYPHQFSGGMRQRVLIAIALACRPELLIADEATTALDVTVQAQILDILRDLRREMGTSIIWITHDMGVVAGLADMVQVMYGGRILERGPVRDIFASPRNAYTWGLLQCLPTNARRAEGRLYQIQGSPPDLYNPPKGDAFASRNEFATPRCHAERPPLVQVSGGASGHLAATWYDLPALLAARKAQQDAN